MQLLSDVRFDWEPPLQAKQVHPDGHVHFESKGTFPSPSDARTSSASLDLGGVIGTDVVGVVVAL